MKADAPIVIVWPPVSPAAIPALCEAARQLLQARPSATVVWDVSAIDRPDATTVDAIARLQLSVQRLGSELKLRNPDPALLELIDLAGLAGVVSSVPPS